MANPHQVHSQIRKQRLYNELLKCSTFASNPNYQSYNDKRAEDVFKEFSIEYYYNTIHPGRINVRDYIDSNGEVISGALGSFIKKQRSNVENEKADYYANCACKELLVHCFIIMNKITFKCVDPIGRICIFRFCDDTTRQAIDKFLRLVKTKKYMCLMCKKFNVKQDYSICKKCKKTEINKEQLENDMMGGEDHRTAYKDIYMDFGKYKFRPLMRMARHLGYCNWLLGVTDIMEQRPYLHKFLLLNKYGLL